MLVDVAQIMQGAAVQPSNAQEKDEEEEDNSRINIMMEPLTEMMRLLVQLVEMTDLFAEAHASEDDEALAG